MLKLRERIIRKLGIEEKTPKEKSKTQTSNKPFPKLFQRLCDDNKEYSEHLNRLEIENLKFNGKGKEDKELIFYRNSYN